MKKFFYKDSDTVHVDIPDNGDSTLFGDTCPVEANICYPES